MLKTINSIKILPVKIEKALKSLLDMKIFKDKYFKYLCKIVWCYFVNVIS